MTWRTGMIAAGTLIVLASASLLLVRHSGPQEIRADQYEQFFAMVDDCPPLRLWVREMVRDEVIDRREFQATRRAYKEFKAADIRRRLRAMNAPNLLAPTGDGVADNRTAAAE